MRDVVSIAGHSSRASRRGSGAGVVAPGGLNAQQRVGNASRSRRASSLAGVRQRRGGTIDHRPPPPRPAAASPAEYVGMDTCVQCHEEVVTAFKTTPHMASAKGCEGCHGPGKDHAEAGGDKTKIKVFKDPERRRVVGGLHGLPQQGRPEALDGLDPRQPPGSPARQCHNPHPKAGEPVAKALLKAAADEAVHELPPPEEGPADPPRPHAAARGQDASARAATTRTAPRTTRCCCRPRSTRTATPATPRSAAPSSGSTPRSVRTA